MRITNKIIQNNNLSNINNNKVMQDKLSTQMSTKKKINRPSEDPVIAIRALRLRSNVTEITQYYSRNIPDAEKWLDLTESAIDAVSQILTGMIKQYETGAAGYKTSDDRQIILEQLKGMRESIYATGDTDYAGRYVFTGHRTDTSLSFREPTELKYQITQQLNRNAIEQVTYVNTMGLENVNSSNYKDILVYEADVSAVSVPRIRLAYDNCTAGELPLIEKITGVNPDGSPIVEPLVDPADIQQVHSYDVPSAYELAADPANADKAFFIPETGELILGQNVYTAMMGLKDAAATSTVNEGEIRITYQKDKWLKGDLRPEHYYACTSTKTVDGVTKSLEYNPEYLNGIQNEKQMIEYDVGFSQTIHVNTTAEECFDPNIGREVDDMIRALQEAQDMEKVVKDLEKQLESATSSTDIAALQSRLDAAKKALTLSGDKLQKMFESGITTMQKFLDRTNLAITNCGTRSSKLELIENRLKDQKTSFEILQSENEDAEITEVAINLQSASLTYESALMAAAKVMQTSLLNFI